ncbi:hypothetical protein PHYBLDRAFT_72876 [Phycomyces blakesleeanus NRRL 1555(-)]|uniref:ISXO2-like transposase domain-containing protein n=1 Tax=Phycomyces blakesleeanus (strain ATCC 8743b / DSM 1359 / FGSC 10004 / NBRC 33097 / NRRL 1555) TaxID=763407 RepID=A0A162PZ93_PHYB8|nr:hypothetical protein PHYBLDRAFT_72876 [Phycomyces blakesleeanus NRRL 1555(-)]OAD75686.1 hypothetical protein PHYBLDRAFT_72876 [Phycomyces blakesleeanus NRRL 1555(-)]|eukprot:XP_018293726.1 hypothetical protein PHYBLDRAFT_72876 [Phycomyces blakesleeanus NRRL 1555(-)]
MGATCCKRERKSERLNSFFAQRHLCYDIVMQGIYYWLNRIPRMTMGVMLGVSPGPMRHLIARVPQRDAATLLQVIKKYVKPNSIIHTDYWAAYGGLTSVVNMNYTHRTVNHNGDRSLE